MRFRSSKLQVFAILLTIQLALLSPRSAAAQEPPIIDRLIGAWEGNGTLFGAEAGFSMKWEYALGKEFVRLTFENRMQGSDGKSRVLRAEAFYRHTDEGRFEGTWFDSRGMVLPLKSVTEADTLTTLWGSPETEQGRTVYRLTGENQLEVEDYVLKDEEWRRFGQATYSRLKPLSPQPRE